jgi:hypothetical protein
MAPSPRQHIATLSNTTILAFSSSRGFHDRVCYDDRWLDGVGAASCLASSSSWGRHTLLSSAPPGVNKHLHASHHDVRRPLHQISPIIVYNLNCCVILHVKTEGAMDCLVHAQHRRPPCTSAHYSHPAMMVVVWSSHDIEPSQIICWSSSNSYVLQPMY